MRLIKDLKNILPKVVFSISLACTELYTILFKRVDVLELELATINVVLESNLDRLEQASDRLNEVVDTTINFYNKANLYVGELKEIKTDVETIRVTTEAMREELDEDPPPVSDDEVPVILDEETAVETVKDIAPDVNKELDERAEANKKLLEEAAQSLDSSMDKVEAIKSELDNLRSELEKAAQEHREMTDALAEEAHQGNPGNYAVSGSHLIDLDTRSGKLTDFINNIVEKVTGTEGSAKLTPDEAKVYEQVSKEFGTMTDTEGATLAKSFDETKEILETQGREAAIEHAKNELLHTTDTTRPAEERTNLAESYVNAIQDRIDVENAKAGVQDAYTRVLELAEQISQEQNKYKEALEQVKEEYDKYSDVSSTAHTDATGRLDEGESYDGSEGGGGDESGERDSPRESTGSDDRAERERERAEREKRDREERAEKYFKDYLDEFGGFD